MSHCAIYGHFYDLPLVRSSYLAVDFFFVLSGFVISHAGLSRIDSWRSVGTFLIRRFGRVWPLHAVMLTCFIGLELVKWFAIQRGAQFEFGAFAPPIFEVSAIPANLALVHALGMFPANTWNRPSWSISTEFYTYLLFAVCTLTVRRWLIPVSLFLIGITATILFTHVRIMDTTYDYAFPRCIFGFFVGHLVHRAHLRFTAPKNGATAIELALACAVSLFIIRAGTNQLSILSPLVFSVPVWFFSFERGGLSRVLLSKPFQALGTWSYGIYMVHEFLFVLVIRTFRGLSRKLGTDLFISHRWLPTDNPSSLISFGNPWLMDALALASLAGVILVAYFAHRFIERPAQSYFQGLAKRLDGVPARGVPEQHLESGAALAANENPLRARSRVV